MKGILLNKANLKAYLSLKFKGRVAEKIMQVFK